MTPSPPARGSPREKRSCRRSRRGWDCRRIRADAAVLRSWLALYHETAVSGRSRAFSKLPHPPAPSPSKGRWRGGEVDDPPQAPPLYVPFVEREPGGEATLKRP